jgi:glycosyltransferase involved in cell wall biosynthesis
MKICFWGNIGRALNGRTSGGGELQIALLAKALARGGHEVVILDSEISEEFQTDEGIKVCPIKGWNEGIKMLRILTHKLPSLYSSLRDQKADVYYCRIRNFMHIVAWLVARKVKAKFILALAEDLDAMSFRMRWKYYYSTNLSNLWGLFDVFFSEIVYPHLIRRSDAVFVQHEGQKQILLQKGIKSILLPNLIDLTQMPIVSNPAHDYFIFVGWLDNRKGVTDLFRLIEKAPFAKFKIIGPPRDKTGYQYYEKLKSFQNVSLMGELNHSDALRHIADSKALINTSRMEGFPNIFIEAWAYGIPVLSLYVDPGSVIEKKDLGEVAHGSFDKLLQAMKNYRNSTEFANRAKAYVEETHVLNPAKIEEISCLFSKLINQENSPKEYNSLRSDRN